MNRPHHPNKYLTGILVGILALNQLLIFGVSKTMGMAPMNPFALFSVQGVHAMEIMMPVPNEGGMTTNLKMMPTITELPAEPNTGDAVADAKRVMIATGAPFYAPAGISFDDPIGALKAWGAYERMELPSELLTPYNKLIATFPCNFCCGSPTGVTLNGRCGCAHAIAARGFFKYMLKEYGTTYSVEQLYGEAYRWQAIWYPSGVVEDYLLATGRGSVLGHKTHGGAGEKGMHGIGE